MEVPGCLLSKECEEIAILTCMMEQKKLHFVSSESSFQVSECFLGYRGGGYFFDMTASCKNAAGMG